MSTTFCGIDVVVPSGWIAIQQGSHLKIVGPEQDVTIYLAKTPFDEPLKVIESIWADIDPDCKPTGATCSDYPANDGWDSVVGISYDLPLSQSRIIKACCMQHEGDMYTTIIDGTVAGLSRRGAQVQNIIMSWKPQGLQGWTLSGKAPKVWGEEDSLAFEKFISKAMNDLGIPGAVAAVVTKEKVVFKGAFGVKDTRTGENVTENTLFKIGSTTKPLTSLLIAKLVDEGVVGWEDPVTKYIPEFKLATAEATERMTLRNCVSSASGMPRQDVEMLVKFKGTAEDRVADLRNMSPTTGQGEVFQYSNPMVSLAGYAAARAVEPDTPLLEAYSKVMKEKVFDPLGMKTATLRLADANPLNRASPHGYFMDGTPCGFDVDLDQFTESVSPAGNGWCSVDDLAKYIQLELNNDGSYIRPDNLLERRNPLVEINRDLEYAHCLMIDRKYGIEIYGHDGGTLGFTTMMMFIPAIDIGLVIFANVLAATNAFLAIRAKFFELLFDAPKQAEDMLEGLRISAGKDRKALQSKISQDPADVEAVVGLLLGRTLSNPELGDLKVQKVGPDFQVTVGDLEAKIAMLKGDEPAFCTFDLHMTYLTFAIKSDDQVILELGQKRYIFS